MDEKLLNRVREALVDVTPIEEKRMFGGICFMVDKKLCICVNNHHEMLCRIHPDDFNAALELDGVRPMQQRQRTAKGYVFVHEDVLVNKNDFHNWVQKALDYNKIAKPGKKRTK